MSMINGIRTVNALTAGTMNATALQTYLGVAQNSGAFNQALNMGGQASLMASSVSAITAIMGSALAMSLVQQSPNMVTKIVASPIALPAVKATRAAVQLLCQSYTSNQAFEPGYPWTVRPGANFTSAQILSGYQSIGYNGTNLYIALSGVIAGYWTSPDTVNWTQHSLPFPTTPTCVLWADNQWMIGYNGFPILTSPDGINWTQQSTTVTDVISIAYGAGTYVLCTSTTTYFTSTNGGVTWVSNTAAGPLRYCTFSSSLGMFVAGANSTSVYYSTTGTAWTAVAVVSGVWVPVWNGTIFYLYASGTTATYTSTTGTAWTAGLALPSAPGGPGAIQFANGVWAFNPNTASCYATTNPATGGVAWASTPFPDTSTTGSLSSANNIFFYQSTGVTNYPVFTSTNATSWTFRFLSGSSAGVPYAVLKNLNGNFVAISQSSTAATFAFSADGVTWSQRAAPVITAGVPNPDTWHIDYNASAGLYLAIGNTNSGANYWTSPDLLTWTNRSLPATPLTLASATGSILAAGNGVFIYIDSSYNFHVSADGLSWTAGSAPWAANWTIAFSNGLFMAMEAGSTSIKYSANPLAGWTSTSPSYPTTSFAYNPVTGAICISSPSNGIYTSTNAGQAWTVGPASGVCVTYMNGVFVAGSNLSSSVLTSLDGLNWNTRNFLNTTTSGVYGVCAAANGAFVIMGTNNQILTSFL